MEHYKIDMRVHRIPPKTLSWAQKCLLSMLKFRCNHKGKCWWSNKKLADDFQVSLRSIQMWCRKLERLGLIKIHRTVGNQNEISVPEFTDEKLWSLGSRWKGGAETCMGHAEICTGGMQESARGHAEICTPNIKGKLKMKNKTGGDSATKRTTVEEIWKNVDVLASGKRAVTASKKQKRMPTIRTVDNVFVVPENEEDFDLMTAKWPPSHWAKEFIRVMGEQGYEVSFFRYKILYDHVTSIRSHLLNRGFNRLKIHRFLLGWFPKAYADICEAEFNKDPTDFMFSVSWLEPRLSRLVDLYNEDEGEDCERPTPKKRRIDK